jgi:hypothetical protein
MLSSSNSLTIGAKASKVSGIQEIVRCWNIFAGSLDGTTRMVQTGGSGEVTLTRCPLHLVPVFTSKARIDPP